MPTPDPGYTAFLRQQRALEESQIPPTIDIVATERGWLWLTVGRSDELIAPFGTVHRRDYAIS